MSLQVRFRWDSDYVRWMAGSTPDHVTTMWGTTNSKSQRGLGKYPAYSHIIRFASRPKIGCILRRLRGQAMWH